jgi:Tol biopolymer transport system component
MIASVSQDHRSLVLVPTTGEGTTDPLVQGASGDDDPAVSPKGDRLAFSSTRNGDRHIWTSRLDGRDARELTSGVTTDEHPAWSPDAATIAFVSSRGPSRSIWIVAADGSGLRKVADTPVIDTVTWSPDGKELAYSAPAGAAPAIFRIRTDGGKPVQIATADGATAPCWSAARNLIAYVATAPPKDGVPTRATLALMTPDGHPIPLPWTDSPRLYNGAVAWSADSQQIAAITNPGAIDSQVFLFNLSSSSPTRLLLRLRRRLRAVTWLPDKTKLIVGLSERPSDIVLFDQGS